MRGALDTSMPLIIVFGIIPAYAGSTIYSVNANGALRDHPRVCGEHKQVRLRLSMLVGSSPRMRGAPAEQVKQLDARGDHPRVCGEHA